jgi:predicted ATPase
MRSRVNSRWKPYFRSSREVLLVMDNCEHLLVAAARLTDTLLLACPKLKILASSLIPLGITGEVIYRVPSLAYPESPQYLTVENQLEYAAVRLLVERARLSLPEYQVTAQNSSALVRICQRLDGIPLALELAAARLNVLTAEQVADRWRTPSACWRLGRTMRHIPDAEGGDRSGVTNFSMKRSACSCTGWRYFLEVVVWER